MVGLWLAGHAPDRVKLLILLCTAAYMPPASYWQERARVVREAGSVEPIADGVLARWLTPEFAASHPELAAALHAMLAAAPFEGYAACRSAITVALLTALGREQELELHLRAARTNGLSDDEIAEVLLHTGVYAGVPAANAAFALAARVLEG